MRRSPEIFIHRLGQKVRETGNVIVTELKKPENIGLAGVFLTLSSVGLARRPVLAIPTLAIGIGLMVYSTRRMERNN